MLFPKPECKYTEVFPGLLWIPFFDDKKKDPVIPCLLVPSPTPSDKIIVYFHGNAEDLYHVSSFLEPIVTIWKVISIYQVHAIAVEYPTYGLYKKASMSEKNMRKTALSVYQYLIEEHHLSPDQIIFFGRSIGSGLACYLAHQRPSAALVLVAPFRSVKKVSEEHVGCISCCAPNIFKNDEAISQVKCPTAIVHGMIDEVIHHSNGHELHKVSGASPDDKFLSQPEHVTHNKFMIKKDIADPVKKFLNDRGVLGTPKGSILDIKKFKAVLIGSSL